MTSCGTRSPEGPEIAAARGARLDASGTRRSNDPEPEQPAAAPEAGDRGRRRIAEARPARDAVAQEGLNSAVWSRIAAAGTRDRPLAVVAAGRRPLPRRPAGQCLHLHGGSPAPGREPVVSRQAGLLELHQHLGRPLVRRGPAERLSRRTADRRRRHGAGKHVGLLPALPAAGPGPRRADRNRARRRAHASSPWSPDWRRPWWSTGSSGTRPPTARRSGATVFFCTFPVSPVLQVPYAESLNLLLLAAALLLVVERRLPLGHAGGAPDVPVAAHRACRSPRWSGCCSSTGCGSASLRTRPRPHPASDCDARPPDRRTPGPQHAPASSGRWPA